VDDVAALKQQPDKDICLVGGGRTAAILIEAGLVDELRLIVYLADRRGRDAALATTQTPRGPQLQKVEQRPEGKFSLIYAIGR
jgi:dihydrofolate reductase